MASNGKEKDQDQSSSSTSNGSPDGDSKRSKVKRLVLNENTRSLVDASEEDDLKKISSTSIKTNSKLVNDVICDLSSLSSETMQPNIELSAMDKQRIEQFKTRHRQRKSYGFRGLRKRFVFDVSYFKTCSFFKQLFIIILSFLAILDGCILRNGELPGRVANEDQQFDF